MGSVLSNISDSLIDSKRLLAVLIDPDKMDLLGLPIFMSQLNASIVTHVFVGGSSVDIEATELLVKELKNLTKLPIVLFPGDITQITENADALLFLSLISGRNADYLIDKHVKAAAILKDTELEIIPTGYILIENGKETSVQKVTKTTPMNRYDVKKVVDTAKAGELLGQRLMYLEAGSGATDPIDSNMISQVKKALSIPLLVGGGIRSKDQLLKAYEAG
ncbi:MAG: geranylgeranylglyceryl/heptaprenylglyceryl phosphate synthase, partial [Flavobacteriaceae bacterium]|nr:geranylgeranylglyceryl/heptaprenylglyceryl phosphate synthase [Bacteroidia bacterium]NNL61973.1 geranylgeranylglyceryl/heptaprenylglyceryl phosphate synthase [Flavobacteriaceae bacterium]